MSPFEQGDICREQQRVTTSGVNFCFLERWGGLCQTRRTSMLERAAGQAPEERMREDGEAARAHAGRGRPSPRRLPARMRDRILILARTRLCWF